MNGRVRNRVMGFWLPGDALYHIYGIGVSSALEKKKKSTLVWEKQNCKNKCYSGKEVGNVEKSEEGPIFCISGLT